MRTPFGSNILDAACRLPVPFIMLFAIYVVIHGHDSPGGGFQGGAILAAIMILIRMTTINTGTCWVILASFRGFRALPTCRNSGKCERGAPEPRPSC